MEENKEIRQNTDDVLNDIEKTIEEDSFAEKPAGAAKKKKKKIVLFIVIGLIAALGIFRGIQAFTPAEETVIPPVNVKIQTVSKGTISADSPLTGRVEAVNDASVIPMVAGEVTDVFVDLGDRVSEGQLLFTIDSTQYTAAFDQAAAGYNVAQTGLTSAQNNLQRMKTLYEAGAVSLQQYEAAQTSYDQAVQSVNQTSAVMQSAGNSVSYCNVTAPISGYITSLNVNRGGIASQSMPALTIADTGELEINVDISEYLITKVKQGDPVSVQINAASDSAFEGIVKYLAPAPAAGSLTYDATISVNDPDGLIAAGMFAEVSISTDKKTDILCIPSSAVFVRSGKTLVAVLDKNRIPELREVEVGLDSGQQAEIVSGLAEGETIVISGQEYVSEGVPVNVK